MDAVHLFTGREIAHHEHDNTNFSGTNSFPSPGRATSENGPWFGSPVVNWPAGLGPRCTFSVADAGAGWQVRREAELVGNFHSRGDAVRAACCNARAEERRGQRARVVAAPGEQLMPHYEPHFGL